MTSIGQKECLNSAANSNSKVCSRDTKRNSLWDGNPNAVIDPYYSKNYLDGQRHMAQNRDLRELGKKKEEYRISRLTRGSYKYNALLGCAEFVPYL